ERGLPRATGAATALSVVGRRWRDVPHVDHVELGDVDTELHRRRAEENGKLRCTEAVLALLPLVGWYLSGVLARLDPLPTRGHAAGDVDEVRVRARPVGRGRGHTNRVVVGAGPVARPPAHRRRRKLVARHVLSVGRLRDSPDLTPFDECL